MGRHALPQQLPYTWSGFVWVYVVIINCHVANSGVESLPVFIVLFKSADKTQRQTGQLQAHSRSSVRFSLSVPTSTLPPHLTSAHSSTDWYTCCNLNTLCT